MVEQETNYLLLFLIARYITRVNDHMALRRPQRSVSAHADNFIHRAAKYAIFIMYF